MSWQVFETKSDIWVILSVYYIDPALTDDERNAKTSHLTILIQEEERKREAYRVSSDLFCFNIEVWCFVLCILYS